MKDVAQKLRTVETALSKEKGPFRLFALFLRENAPDVWDVVVSADWIDQDQVSAHSLLAGRVRRALGPRLILRIARVVIVDRDNPGLRSVAASVAVRHGLTEVHDCSFFGLEIKRGYVITARATNRAA